MTQTEYAQHLGLNKSTVSRQVKSGLIPVDATGLIDPLVADQARAAYLQENKRRLQPVPAAPGASVPPALPSPEPDAVHTSVQSDAPLLAEQLLSASPAVGSLAEAQAQERRAKARMAELELARREGSLISLPDVKAGLSRLVLAVKSKLLTLPGEIEHPASHALVERRVREILTDLSTTDISQLAAEETAA